MDVETINALADKLSGPASKLYSELVVEQVRLGWITIYSSLVLLVIGLMGFVLSAIFYRKYKAGPSLNSWDVGAFLTIILSFITVLVSFGLVWEGLAKLNAPQSWALRVLLGS